MMKKQSVYALVLVLLIPVVVMTGGFLATLIDPEIAIHTRNYARNFHLLTLLKTTLFLGSVGVAGVLWIIACFLLIRSKRRSPLWIVLAALGPIGFAVLATMNDRAAAQPDRYALFVRTMRWFVRAPYELGYFVAVWVLAWEAMVLNRELIISYQAITTGVSRQQIIDIQNASSGMWAFSEGNEVMYLVILLYVLRPLVFCLIADIAARRSFRKAL